MKKNIALMSLYITLPVVLAMVVFGQFVGRGGFNGRAFIVEFIMAFVLATIIIYLIPLDKMGKFIVDKFKKLPDSLAFGIIMNIGVNGILAFFIGLAMNIYNVTILGAQPLTVAFRALAKSFIPTFIVSFIVSFIGFSFYKKEMDKRAE